MFYRSRSSTHTSVSPSHSSQSTLLEIINKRASFESGGSKNTTITEALIYMICRDNMSIRCVEREGFSHFVKTICPIYKIPSRSTVTILIEQKYDKCKLYLKDLLSKVHHVSLTSDICTIMNSTRSFLVITSHFINPETSILESICLKAIQLTERHTGENIVKEFYNVCEEFSIYLSKIVCITTDGASNMQKAVELFSNSSKWIKCFAHVTNLVVQNSLKSTTELEKIIVQIKRIVTYFKHSTIASDALRAEQVKLGRNEGNILYLTQDICTRWNSTLEMIQKFEKLAPILGTILASKDHKDGPQMLAGSHLEVVSEIIRLLEPFKEATIQISSDSNVTASIVLPLCHNVYDTLNKFEPVTYPAIELKQNLLKEIEAKYIPLEKNKLLIIATLLDPRFKKVYRFSALSQADAILQVHKEMKDKAKQNFCPLPEQSPPKQDEILNSIWAMHTEKLKKNSDEDELSAGQIPPELKLYFNSAVLPLSEDLIKYWQSCKTFSPALMEVALKYCIMMGSSVASERAVSALNNVVTDKRNRLTSRHIDQAVFLAYFTKKMFKEYC